MKKLLFLALLLCFMNQSTWAEDWTEVNDESSLNTAIHDGAHILLTADITLSEYLKIGQSGKQTVEINLDGHILRRAGLKKAETNGHVIEVWGTSTLTLYGGTLTGGWANNGGAICNYGTVTLSNVTIKGCKANQGGAIKNNENATLTLNGGVNITGNECAEEGGGIWSDGTLNMSGANTIMSNMRTNALTNNIYLIFGKVITVTGDLGDSQIGVCVDGHDGIITSGLGEHGNASNFSNDMNYATDLSTENGEIKLTEMSQIYYIERSWDDVNKKVVSTARTVAEYTALNGIDEDGSDELESGKWYVVSPTFNKRHIYAPEGNAANLIVPDNFTLTVGSIIIKEGCSLNIYGQAYDTGKIIAKSTTYTTRVPDGSEEIYRETSFPGIGSIDKMGTLVIHGGIVNAGVNKASHVPGIGKRDEGYGGTVVIYGGDITAYGGQYAAGIGGAQDGSGIDVTVYGGTVRAYGSNDSAGIGSGEEGTFTPACNGGTLNVYGGYVYADGTGWGAGIGGGEDSDGATVNIQGGVVEAWAGADAGAKNGSAIGSEDGDGHRGSLTIGDKMMVHAGKDPTDANSHLFPSGTRVPACHFRPFARIEPCDHQGATYSFTNGRAGGTHTVHCSHCTYRTPEEHTFGVDDRCTVCGVEALSYYLNLYTPDGSGTDGSYTHEAFEVAPGIRFTLPQPPTVNEPKNREFAGWLVGDANTASALGTYDTNDNEHLLPVGYDYIVNEASYLIARYKSVNVTLVDNADNWEKLMLLNGKDANTVTFSGRTLYKDDSWNTLYLPFSLTAEQLAASPLAGAQLKVLSTSSFNEDTGELTVVFGDDTKIMAGVPYLIKWEKDVDNIVNPVFNNVTIDMSTTSTVTECVEFNGTYSPVGIYQEGDEKTNLYLSGDNKLYYPSRKGFTVNAFRGYFQLKNNIVAGDVENPAAARSFNVNFIDDDVTGIRSANASHPVDNAWYSIDGRRLNHKPTRSGIYVNNRRKIVIK